MTNEVWAKGQTWETPQGPYSQLLVNGLRVVDRLPDWLIDRILADHLAAAEVAEPVEVVPIGSTDHLEWRLQEAEAEVVGLREALEQIAQHPGATSKHQSGLDWARNTARAQSRRMEVSDDERSQRVDAAHQGAASGA